MPILIDQSAQVATSYDRDGNLEGARFRWWVNGTNDEDVVGGLVLAASSETYLNLYRLGVYPQTIDSNHWECDVDYGLRDDELPEFGFEIGTTTAKVLYAKSQAKFDPTGLTAPDVGLAIGVTPDGIEGVDILIPTGCFSYALKLTDAQVTDGYKDLLFAATGTTNNAPWKGKAAGEVLFLGSSGAKRGRAKWDVQYRFAYSKNVSGTIAGVPSVTKSGWNYVWTMSADKIDNTAKAMTKQVRGLYVATVYDSTDFSALGLGV